MGGGGLIVEQLRGQPGAKHAHGVVHGQRVTDVKAKIARATARDAAQPVKALVSGDGVRARVLPAKHAGLGSKGGGRSGVERIHVTGRQSVPKDVTPQPVHVDNDETAGFPHRNSHPMPTAMSAPTTEANRFTRSLSSQRQPRDMRVSVPQRCSLRSVSFSQVSHQ